MSSSACWIQSKIFHLHSSISLGPLVSTKKTEMENGANEKTDRHRMINISRSKP